MLETILPERAALCGSASRSLLPFPRDREGLRGNSRHKGHPRSPTGGPASAPGASPGRSPVPARGSAPISQSDRWRRAGCGGPLFFWRRERHLGTISGVFEARGGRRQSPVSASSSRAGLSLPGCGRKWALQLPGRQEKERCLSEGRDDRTKAGGTDPALLYSFALTISRRFEGSAILISCNSSQRRLPCATRFKVT